MGFQRQFCPQYYFNGLIVNLVKAIKCDRINVLYTGILVVNAIYAKICLCQDLARGVRLAVNYGLGFTIQSVLS